MSLCGLPIPCLSQSCQSELVETPLSAVLARHQNSSAAAASSHHQTVVYQQSVCPQLSVDFAVHDNKAIIYLIQYLHIFYNWPTKGF